MTDFEIPKRSVLYYPYINVANSVWLRHALLYWDEIGSIVPRDNEGNDALKFSPEQTYLQSLGVYNPCRPEDVLLDGISLPQLENELKDVLNDIGGAYGIPERQPSVGSPDWYLISPNKVAESTLDFFLSTGAIKRSGGKLKMLKIPFLIYMALLAKYVAIRSINDTRPSTDEADYQNIAYGVKEGQPGIPSVSLILQKILPAPSEDIPFESILLFKDKHKTELGELWKRISDFQHQIRDCESASDIKDSIVTFSTSIESDLANLRAALRENRILFVAGTVTSWLTFQAGDLIKAVGLSADISPILLKLPIGLVGVNYCLTRLFEGTRILRESTVSYLHHVDQELTL